MIKALRAFMKRGCAAWARSPGKLDSDVNPPGPNQKGGPKAAGRQDSKALRAFIMMGGCAAWDRRPAADGFTLIELLVVISLISLMLFLAVPQFQYGVLSDGSRKSLILLKQTVEGLKTRAVEAQTVCALHLNLDTHHFWITDETMDEEQRLEANRNATDLSDSLFFEEVEFVDEEKSRSGEVSVYFYPEGFSDRARIHVQKKDGDRSTLRVESFLAEVRIEDDFVSYRP